MFVMRLGKGLSFPENTNKVQIEEGVIRAFDSVDPSKEILQHPVIDYLVSDCNEVCDVIRYQGIISQKKDNLVL